MKNIFSADTLKHVAAGVAGGAATLPVKKFALSKIPFIKEKESYQDITTIVAGIAIGAFSKGSMMKTFGLGMSLVGGYNLVKPLIANAGIGATDVLMGEIPSMNTGGNVLMGATDGAGNDYSSSSYDYSPADAGEMDF